MKLYLIRHGESEANRIGKIQGWKDFPLSSVGKQQANQLGQYFSQYNLDFLYSSDLTRAFETAKAIESFQSVSVNKWDKIREVCLGPLEGKTKEEIFNTYPEMRERSLLVSGLEGAETIPELTERCTYVLDQLRRAHHRHQIAIVSHGGFISIFLMYLLLGEDWHLHHRPFQIDNTGVTLVEWNQGDKPIIKYINRNTHLDENDEGLQKSML